MRISEDSLLDSNSRSNSAEWYQDSVAVEGLVSCWCWVIVASWQIDFAFLGETNLPTTTITQHHSDLTSLNPES
jgi:hypothetical protein